mgnify:CR=1 FL=1
MTEKTFNQLVDETELNELNEGRLIRSGTALAFASKVREHGKRLESSVRSAQGELNKISTAPELYKKINLLADALSKICDGLIANRMMIGSLTGGSVSGVLFSEKTNKEMTKLLKPKGRR